MQKMTKLGTRRMRRRIARRRQERTRKKRRTKSLVATMVPIARARLAKGEQRSTSAKENFIKKSLSLAFLAFRIRPSLVCMVSLQLMIQ